MTLMLLHNHPHRSVIGKQALATLPRSSLIYHRGLVHLLHVMHPPVHPLQRPLVRLRPRNPNRIVGQKRILQCGHPRAQSQLLHHLGLHMMQQRQLTPRLPAVLP